MWLPKPEILISLEVWQIRSKFQRQICYFRLQRARRSCLQASTTTTENRKWQYGRQNRKYIYPSLEIWQQHRNSNGKSRLFDYSELQETVRRRLVTWSIPEMVMWQPKPEIFLSLELKQSESKFHWQIWGFQSRRARRKCVDATAINGNSNM